jgi:hypothetical protein
MENVSHAMAAALAMMNGSDSLGLADTMDPALMSIGCPEFIVADTKTKEA